MKKILIAVASGIGVLALAAVVLWLCFRSDKTDDTVTNTIASPEYTVAYEQTEKGYLVTLSGIFDKKSWDVESSDEKVATVHPKADRANSYSAEVRPAGEGLATINFTMIDESDRGYGYTLELAVFTDTDGKLEILGEGHTRTNNTEEYGTVGDIFYQLTTRGTTSELLLYGEGTEKWLTESDMGDCLSISSGTEPEQGVTAFTLTGNSQGTGSVQFIDDNTGNGIDMALSVSYDCIITLLSVEEYEGEEENAAMAELSIDLLGTMGSNVYPESLEPCNFSYSFGTYGEDTSYMWVSMLITVSGTELEYSVYDTLTVSQVESMFTRDTDTVTTTTESGKTVTLITGSEGVAVWQTENCVSVLRQSSAKDDSVISADALGDCAAAVISAMENNNGR